MSEKKKKRYLWKTAVLAVILSVLICVLTAGCGAEQEDGLEEIRLTGEEDSGADLTEDGSGGDPAEDNPAEGDPGTGSGTEDPAGKGPADDPDGSGDRASAGGEDGAAAQTVFVYVCGAVNAPGVYEIESGARVFEAIRLAGGLSENAAADAVNQARPVTDGEQIRVPTEEEAQNSGAGSTAEGDFGAVTEGTEKRKVNINTAGKEELMTLTGIGEAKAESIIEYRTENGRFGSIEDLMLITGIKEGVFNKIKDDITV